MEFTFRVTVELEPEDLEAIKSIDFADFEQFKECVENIILSYDDADYYCMTGNTSFLAMLWKWYNQNATCKYTYQYYLDHGIEIDSDDAYEADSIKSLGLGDLFGHDER